MAAAAFRADQVTSTGKMCRDIDERMSLSFQQADEQQWNSLDTSPSSSVVAVSDWRVRDGYQKSSLHRAGLEVRRQLQTEVVEQD